MWKVTGTAFKNVAMACPKELARTIKMPQIQKHNSWQRNAEAKRETIRKQVTTLAAFQIISVLFELLNIYGNLATKSQFLQNPCQDVYWTGELSAGSLGEFVLSKV
jgi:hypothetical protein